MLLDILTERKFDGVSEISMKSLPKIGYIAMLENNPIATGFLRRTEGDLLAHIEGVASNPFFGSIIRHKGLDMVLKQLIDEANHLDIKGVLAFTVDYTVLNRAKDLGFNCLEDTKLLSLRLKD